LIIMLFAIMYVGFAQSEKPAKVFVKTNNIYVAFTNGKEKQLTFNGSDRNPILLMSENNVIYIRGQKVNSGNNPYTKNQVMKVNIGNLLESVVTDQKPYQDGRDGTYEILDIIGLTLSLDNKHVYFITEKYATGNQIVKVNLTTGVWKELFPAETFELITKGQYRGLFLIGQSQVGYKGRDIYFKVCDEKGKTLKDFDSENSLMKFRSEMK